MNPSEDIRRCVQLTGANLVEQDHHDKRVEDERVVDRGNATEDLITSGVDVE